MFRDLLEFVFKALGNVFTIRLIDVPILIAYIGVIGGISYCAAMILIGLPVALWEHFTKKKVNSDIEDKVIKTVAIILAIVCILVVLYQKYI